ncbi:MAG TPA: methylated-DNA--[protein]-cysteine S-methyltransferase [Candidatus Acidoferrales bacterium]|nr:methylated-DNA--[protein]-cysteine S-methyltransferase [Candidatus Acidoferrales bacterium]
MHLRYHVMSASSPLGLLFLAATERGLRHLEFLDRRSLKRAIAAHERTNPGATWEHSVREMRPLADQLEQFLCGAVRRLDVPLDLAGTEFQLKVWRALLEIPYGETRNYGEIAKAIGEPRAARAVGLAANQNPAVIAVPCHRVIGADGKLVGYVGGLPRKKHLIALETRFRDMLPLEGDRVIAPLKVRVKAAPAPRAVSRSGRSRGPEAPLRRRPSAAARAGRAPR